MGLVSAWLKEEQALLQGMKTPVWLKHVKYGKRQGGLEEKMNGISCPSMGKMFLMLITSPPTVPSLPTNS